VDEELREAMRLAARSIPPDVLARIDAAHPWGSAWDCAAHSEGQECCIDALLAEYRAARPG